MRPSSVVPEVPCAGPPVMGTAESKTPRRDRGVMIRDQDYLGAGGFTAPCGGVPYGTVACKALGACIGTMMGVA